MVKCDKKMTFQECELNILRHAVDKIEKIEDFINLKSIKPIESIYVSDNLKKFICLETFNLFLIVSHRNSYKCQTFVIILHDFPQQQYFLHPQHIFFLNS